MDALTLLTTRKSNKKLTAPAPNAEQLERILKRQCVRQITGNYILIILL